MKVLLISVLIALAFAIEQEHRYMRTPLGLGWSNCQYLLNNGDHIITDESGTTTVISNNGETRTHPPCEQPFIPRVTSRGEEKVKRDAPDDGWQVWASYNNANNATFTAFLGNFVVPEDPANWDESGILYMFTGLQNDNWIPYPGNGSAPQAFEIIQPVLQYGETPAGGGNYWAIANWYVTVYSNYYFSEPQEVEAGDNIFGNMTALNDTTWFIGSVVNGQSSSITVTEADLISNPWAYLTLEVYSIDDCASDFPAGPLKFSNLILFNEKGQSVTPKWGLFNNLQDHCGATITSANPSSAVIDFGQRK